MRVVNLEEFLKLPNGTVFSKYRPVIFDGLKMKDGNCGTDFLYRNLLNEIECGDTSDYIDKITRMEEDSSFSVSLDFDCISRDGANDKNQLFAIYEKADIEGLIEQLQWALDRSSETNTATQTETTSK